MQHHGIEPCERGEPPRHAIAAVGEYPAYLALRGFNVGGSRRRWRFEALLREYAVSETIGVDRRDERTLTAGAHGHRGHHRDAERALERSAVQTVAALLGDVAHVERHDHRPPETS